MDQNVTLHVIMGTCSKGSYTRNDMAGVSSPLLNLPAQVGLGGQCVIPFSWCQSGFDGWVMDEWLSRWPLLRVGRDVVEIQGSWFKITNQSNSRSNSFIIGIYPAACARRYFLMSLTCKMISYIYMYFYFTFIYINIYIYIYIRRCERNWFRLYRNS